MSRAEILRKLKRYKAKPDVYQALSPTELADLVVLVLSQVDSIEQAIKTGRLDGKTPQPDKDYLSKESAQKMLKDSVNKMVSEYDTEMRKKGSALEEQVEAAIQRIRDGRDGIVTEEEIGRAAQLAAALVDLPDFDEEIQKAITSNGEAIRDALELLQGEDRYKVEIADVDGLEERLRQLPRGDGNGMGTSKPAVYQFIRDAISDGIITTGSALTVEEVDGSPSVEVTTIKFPNGSLTDNGDGSATYTPAGSGGDVTAASTFGADNRLIRSDGTGKGVQASGITVSDTDAVSGATIDADNNTISNIALGAEATGAINDLSDVTITTPADNEILAYDGVSEFINQTPSEAGLQPELAEGPFVDGDKTKLDGIEAGADVTDTANVTAAGALMDSEVDADLKTLALPANTTISTFGASVIDDADAATARTTLGVAIGSDVQAWDADLDDWATKAAPTGAAVGTTDTQTLTNKDLTSTTNTFHKEKSITIEDPTSSEDISFFFTNKAITITEMRAVLVGSATPSVTWTVRHGTDRSATGAEVVTSGTTTTGTTSGDDITVFNDATIVADSFVWVETTAQSGTVDELQITVFYTED